MRPATLVGLDREGAPNWTRGLVVSWCNAIQKMIFPYSLIYLLVVDGDGKPYMLHMWVGIEGECYTSLATNRQVLYLGKRRQEKLRTSILNDKKTVIGWVCFCGPWAG